MHKVCRSQSGIMRAQNPLKYPSKIIHQREFLSEIHSNINQLNRSMKSVQKMIQKSRYILNTQNRDKAPKQSQKILITHSYSVSKRIDKVANPLIPNSKQRVYLKHKNNSTLKKQNEVNIQLSKMQREQISQFGKLNDHSINDQQLFKGEKLNSIGAKSRYCQSYNPNNQKYRNTRKKISIFNPESISKTKIKGHKKTISVNLSDFCQQKEQKRQKIMPRKLFQYPQRCKTQYKQENPTQINPTSNKIQNMINNSQMSNKTQITLKLFSKKVKANKQKQSLNQQIEQISRQRKFVVDPPSDLLLRDTIRLNQSYDGIQLRKKFEEKVSQYKFIENYLSKNEIWKIYDKIANEGIPQINWPILLIDEVYKKIRSTQG